VTYERSFREENLNVCGDFRVDRGAQSFLKLDDDATSLKARLQNGFQHLHD
jgi:hypothetical protein